MARRPAQKDVKAGRRRQVAVAISVVVLLLAALGVASVNDVRTHDELATTRRALSSSEQHASQLQQSFIRTKHEVAVDQSQIQSLYNQLSTAQGALNLASGILASLGAPQP